MTHLRRSILILVIYLAIFFNIERLDLGQPDLVNMPSVVYVVVLIACASILAIPWLSRQKLSILLWLWSAIYLVVRFSLARYNPKWPLIGGDYTYLTITEFTFLAITIILTHHVAENLADFYEAVYMITFSEISNRVQSRTQAGGEIEREILRSRRHHTPLSVVVFEADPSTVSLQLNQSVLDVQKSMMTHYALSGIVRIVSNLVRRTDLIVDQSKENGNIIVFCPDTDLEHAELLRERILSLIKEQVGTRMCTGVATFPDQALTYEELVKVAYDQIVCEKSSPIPIEKVSVDQL